MKGWKLAIAMLVLGAMVYIPKAEARNVSNSGLQLSQVPNALRLKNNDKASAYIEQGFQNLEAKKYQQAIANFNKALQIDTDNPYSYLGRGVARMSLEDYQNANTDFSQAVKLNSNIAYGYYFRALTRYRLGDKPGALADLRTSAQLFQEQGNQELAKKALDIIKEIS
jgi:tetratricopeptide (TPR) repeat protein